MTKAMFKAHLHKLGFHPSYFFNSYRHLLIFLILWKFWNETFDVEILDQDFGGL